MISILESFQFSDFRFQFSVFSFQKERRASTARGALREYSGRPAARCRARRGCGGMGNRYVRLRAESLLECGLLFVCKGNNAKPELKTIHYYLFSIIFYLCGS